MADPDTGARTSAAINPGWRACWAPPWGCRCRDRPFLSGTVKFLGCPAEELPGDRIPAGAHGRGSDQLPGRQAGADQARYFDDVMRP